MVTVSINDSYMVRIPEFDEYYVNYEIEDLIVAWAEENEIKFYKYSWSNAEFQFKNKKDAAFFAMVWG